MRHPTRSRFFVSSPLLPGIFILSASTLALFAPTVTGAAPAATPAQLIPLASVRLLDGPFAAAVKANRSYLLALEPDRLLAPFLREAELEPRARPYGNWESSGLGGHTGGHYLSALSTMIASGADTPDGELRRRLDYMLAELERCQQATGDGYIGGVPGGRIFWKEIAAGRIQANGFGLNGKWVPWYNLHKTFAGLRDAYLVAGNEKAREILGRGIGPHVRHPGQWRPAGHGASAGLAMEPQPGPQALVAHATSRLTAADHCAGGRRFPRSPQHAHAADHRPGVLRHDHH